MRTPTTSGSAPRASAPAGRQAGPTHSALGPQPSALVRRPPLWRTFGRHRAAVVGAAVAALLGLVGLLAPWISPYDPTEMDLLVTNAPPSLDHPFGTDDFGRDILSRVIHGARSTLGLAGGSVLLAALAGGLLGLSAGYSGGWVDQVVMRVVDVLLAFPALLLALTLVTFIGPSAATIIAVLAVTHLPRYARLIRGTVLSLREREFVQGARAIGASGPRIIARYLLPNSVAPLVVYATLDLGWMVTAVAGLSFLGFGLQPPEQSWGGLLAEGRQYLALAPWIATFPGLAIAFAVLAFNFVGDGLRDALDPRLRHQT
jgi:peptide/nickel transport system permease protein